jgi:hypothetical protein
MAKVDESFFSRFLLFHGPMNGFHLSYNINHGANSPSPGKTESRATENDPKIDQTTQNRLKQSKTV